MSDVLIAASLMRDTRTLALAVCTLMAGCSRSTRGHDGTESHTLSQPPGLGEVMVQVGARFELAGRAAVANRFELADFEAGELEELFEDDIPRAALPKEGPTAHIPAMAREFAQQAPPMLERAAAKRDRAAFADAFRLTAAMCNGCHQASAKAFIEIPSVPGSRVPVVDPIPQLVQPGPD